MDIKKKNKKGIFPVIGVGVAIVAAIIILMVLLFTVGILNFLKNNVFMSIGVLLLVGVVIFMIKSKGITKSKTTVFFVLLIIGSFFILGSGVLQEELTKPVYTGYIEVPTFGYYECAPSDSPVHGNWANLQDSGSWVKCPSDKTDQCDIEVKLSSGTWDWRKPYVEYEKCDVGGSCFGTKYYFFNNEADVYTIDDLGKNQKVWIDIRRLTTASASLQSLNAGQLLTSLFGAGTQNLNGGQVRAFYTPFILWKESQTEGRHEYTNPEQGCVFPNADRENLLDRSEVLFTLTKSQSSTRDDKLDPYKVRNFVEGFEPRSVENDRFVNWQGDTGYCLDKKIYGIKEVETNEFIYKVVAFNQEFRLDNNGVTCCPGETEPGKTCTDNFQWQTTTQVGCGPLSAGKSLDWEKFDADTVEKFVCEDNEWVQETKDVECTTTAKCLETKGANFVCDTQNFECVAGALVETTSPPGEDEDKNGDDESKCSSLEESVEVNKEYKKGIFSIFGLGKTVTETEVVCKTKDVVKWVIFGAIILGLGLTAILSNKPKRRQSRRRGRR